MVNPHRIQEKGKRMTRNDRKAIAMATALAKVGAKSDKHGEIIAEAMVELGKVFADNNPRFNRDAFYRYYMAHMEEFRSLANIARN